MRRMHNTPDAEELAELARALRAAVARHARAGAWSAPGGKAPVHLPVVEHVPRPSTPAPTPAPAPMIEDAPRPRVRLSLADVRAELGDCTRCKLHTTRNKLVFGTGAEDAALMFVGEAPGADEDRLGEPFVGRAGELLDKMIEAMGWSRHTVYIANILKSRPPGNRNPEPDEVAACFPFLERQIEAIAPRIIVALGRPAANGLLATNAPISALRGKFHDRKGVRVMPTFHPAFLLRTPEKKREAWSDLKLVMAELERLGIAPHK
jgi:DNA polymerase